MNHSTGEATELGRLGLVVGLAVHALAGAAWMEGAHRALGWRERTPAGWQSLPSVREDVPWASPGPLGPDDAPWVLRDGARWAPRQPGLAQQPGSVRALLRLPEGGQAELWAARPGPSQPAPGAVGLVLDRGLEPRAEVVRATSHGWERLPCSDALPVPGEGAIDAEVAPEGPGLRVRVGDETVRCAEQARGGAPAVGVGARAVGLEALEVDGRPAPLPGKTPALVRWLLGGAVAAGLFLAEGALGVAALASMLAVLPLALALVLGGLVPAQLGMVLGLAGGSPSLAWGLPLGVGVWLRVCVHAHHRLSLPPGHRDWPAAAPLAMALLGSLAWGAREATPADLAPVGLGLAAAVALATAVPPLLRRHGEPQPLRTTTWILAPVGAVVLVAGISGAGALALLGGVALGTGAGLGLAVAAGRLGRALAVVAVILGIGGTELAVRGLEAPGPLGRAPSATPLSVDEPGPRRPLVIGGLSHGGGRPGAPASQPLGLRPVLERLEGLAPGTEASGAVLGLRTADFLVQREDLHELRILGSASLARLALLRDLIGGHPPASVSVGQLEAALGRASETLGDRPLVVVVSTERLDAGAAWPWIQALQGLAEADATVELIVHRGDTSAVEAALERLRR